MAFHPPVLTVEIVSIEVSNIATITRSMACAVTLVWTRRCDGTYVGVCQTIPGKQVCPGGERLPITQFT